MKQIITFILLAFLSATVNAQKLYVGTNYHPQDDKNIEKIKNDIKLMKSAGFNVVRMGHLAWDSFEPSEGTFDFAWFDKVMDMMNEAGIKVILDIAVRPAPIWLHYKYPSINIVDENGNMLYPNHRYMEDVGDPNYQQYALDYADVITKRYAKHPALLAFGIDNEPGDGPISYSEPVRQRFIKWLKNKYADTDSLNKAWATQRWSRRINIFDEVGLPQSGSIKGAPERMLDFRRFISDEINDFFLKIVERVNCNAPNALTTTNAWYYSPLKYFDYTKIAYSGKITREGEGFYPGNSLITNYGLMDALFGIARARFESPNPFWCNEFTTMTAVPNSIRKSAYATLMYGNQTVCGWTWQSMWGGEEQYLEGMLDWDGIPNRKYDEYKKIASEFKKIEKYFPYKPHPEVGLAYSFPSQIASSAFPQQHDNQLQTCWNLFYNRNMDVNVIDVDRSILNYKLLFIPGVAVMDKETADKIRNYVEKGGTVIMTSNSALVNKNGQVFATRHPGYLSDVFGIRVASFEDTESLNELSCKSLTGKRMEINYKGKELNCETERFDVVESKGAQVIGNIISLDKQYPIVTLNKYGKGQAIYVGISANESVLNPLLEDIISELSIERGPNVPNGVMAREIDKKHFLYLNVTGDSKVIQTGSRSHSIIFNRDYEDKFSIPPYEPDFIEVK